MPDSKEEDFEKNGAVYYTNADDGTVFDWETNVTVYVYANEGEDSVKEEKLDLCTEDEAFSLAVLLFNVANKEKKYDSNIDKMDFAHEVTEEEKKEFLLNYE